MCGISLLSQMRSENEHVAEDRGCYGIDHAAWKVDEEDKIGGICTDPECVPSSLSQTYS